jgi:hypothetical protein
MYKSLTSTQDNVKIVLVSLSKHNSNYFSKHNLPIANATSFEIEFLLLST